MAEISYNGSFKLSGSGHAVFTSELNSELLTALVQEPADSDFFLPDLVDILDADAFNKLRDAFKTNATVETYKAYQEMLGKFASLQESRVWVLADLIPVWRTRIEGALIDEIIRVKDGRAFVILTGSKELLSEQDLYRRTLKTIGDHLDSTAQDYVTIAKYTKATLQSPIVERRICVSTATGVANIAAWGPECLDCSQWELPAGYTFLTMEA